MAGKPEESLLIAAVNHDGLEMPPEGEQARRGVEIAGSTRWVERGLPWPETDPSVAGTRRHAAAEDAQIAAARAQLLVVSAGRQIRRRPR